MIRTVFIAALLCVVFSTHSEARQRHRHGLPWCGIYLGKYFGKHDRKLWLAHNWASEGVPAGGPGIGVVVVFPHHVGVIVGQDSQGRYLLHSGNDGGRVRTRARSLAGAIAFRRV